MNSIESLAQEREQQIPHPSQRVVLLVWSMLVLATCTSWAIGVTEGGTPGDVHPLNVLLLLIALAKVRFVGLYFMELRTAPRALRTMFEVWAAGTATALSLLYLLL